MVNVTNYFCTWSGGTPNHIHLAVFEERNIHPFWGHNHLWTPPCNQTSSSHFNKPINRLAEKWKGTTVSDGKCQPFPWFPANKPVLEIIPTIIMFNQNSNTCRAQRQTLLGFHLPLVNRQGRNPIRHRLCTFIFVVPSVLEMKTRFAEIHHTHACVYMYACRTACMHVGMHVCGTCIYVYVSVCVRVCMHVCLSLYVWHIFSM